MPVYARVTRVKESYFHSTNVPEKYKDSRLKVLDLSQNFSLLLLDEEGHERWQYTRWVNNGYLTFEFE